MAAGQDQLNRLEYQRMIESEPDNRKVINMLAMDVYDIKINYNNSCPTPDRKQTVYNASGIGGFIGAIGLILWEVIRMVRGG